MLWPVKLVFPHVPVQCTSALITLSAISLLSIIISLPFIYRKTKEVFFGVCLFILFLVPFCSPIAVTNVVAERYLYLPSISLCIFAAFFYEKYANKSYRLRRIILSLFILITSLYSIRTIIRNEDWKTPERLWQATLAVSNNSPSAYNELGRVYLRKGDIEKALAYFKKAVEFNPNDAMVYYNLGVVYGRIGDVDREIVSYMKAIELNPDFARAYNNLGTAYRKIGNIDEEIALYKKAVEINPKYAGAYYNLSTAYKRKKEIELAVDCFNRAIELGFNNANRIGSIEPYRE